MSKHDLTAQIKVIYTGKYFENFRKEYPSMIFLGYDCSGWSTSWLGYPDVLKFVALSDVKLAEVL